MPKVPLAQYTPRQTPNNAVRANPGMFDAEHQALGRVGGAVAGAGDVMADFAMKLQRAENDSLLSDARRQINEAYSQFQETWKTTGSTPEKWESDWNKTLSDTVKKLDRKDSGTLFRREFETLVSDMRQRTSAEVRSVANAKRVENAWGRHELAMDAALKTLDRDSYETELATAERNGIVTDIQANKLRQKAPAAFASQQALRDAMEAPAMTREALEMKDDKGNYMHYGDLEPEQRLQLISTADTLFNRQKRETLEDLYARQAAGEMLDENELNTYVQNKILKPSQVKSILKAQDTAKPETFTGALTELRSDIYQYNPATAERGEYENLFARAMGLPNEMKTAALSELKEKGDPKSPLNRPAAREIFQVIDANYKAGFFGAIERPVPKEKLPQGGLFLGSKIPMEDDPEGIKIAQAARARVQDAVTDYIRAHPEAGYEELLKVATGQSADTVSAAGADMILNFQPTFK